MSKRPDPLKTVQKLIRERYVDAKAVFWAGSVSQGKGTNASDLDLVIVFDSIPQAYREAYVFDEWPIDAFIHDMDTLRYFFEESRIGNGIPGLISMMVNGTEVTKESLFSENIKLLAKEISEKGPIAWDKEQIDKERFLITDVLDDIKHPVSREEQIASATWLYEALSQFYFRSKKQWCASGKSIVRYLKNEDPQLALEFTQSFDKLFQTGETIDLEKLTEKILMPFGGLFWNGFQSYAPKDSRSLELNTLSKTIEQLELSLLEQVARQSSGHLDAIIHDDFIEFGKSGRIFNKQEIIDYLSSEEIKKFTVSDFQIKLLSKDVVLATYKTAEEGMTVLRSSVWKYKNDNWRMVFHQGTKS